MEQDIKENGLNGGTPVKIRALDANGNSIAPNLDEVAKALPKRNSFEIYLEPDESYTPSGLIYNTMFAYETTSSGEGCVALLCWRSIIIWGGSIFANSDTPNKICIFTTANGVFTIKNCTSIRRHIIINIV